MAARLNPLWWSFRQRCLAGFALCAGVVGFAIFSQFQWGLNPCPLCIFQRVAFAVAGVLLLVAGLHAPASRWGRTAYAGLALLPTAVGLAIAGRHVWITHLPADQVPACGPGLDFMLEAFPLGKTLRTVFTGSGECAESDGWFLLGLDMPSWALIGFIGLLIISAYAGFIAKGKEATR